jgi:hypothetical protein
MLGTSPTSRNEISHSDSLIGDFGPSVPGYPPALEMRTHLREGLLDTIPDLDSPRS